MLTLLLSLLVGPISPSEFEDHGGIILREPKSVQLAKGDDPGSFHFERKGLKVGFTMEPDFPVRLIAGDYSGKEVTSTPIKSAKPFDFEIDLPPGSYIIHTKAGPRSTHRYWDSDGFQIHINKDGVAHYDQPPEFSRTFLHRRKIEIVAPKNLSVIDGRRFYFPGDTDPSSQHVSLSSLQVKWKPLPGIAHYEVELWPLNNPHHSNSLCGDPRRYEARGATFRFPKDADDSVGSSERLTVRDEHDISKGYGQIIFLLPQAESEAQKDPEFIGGDEWIDSRTIAKYEQTRGVADYMGDEVVLEAVGNGPANNAGLKPGDMIYSVNGNKIAGLQSLREAMAKASPSQPLVIQAGSSNTKINFEIR